MQSCRSKGHPTRLVRLLCVLASASCLDATPVSACDPVSTLTLAVDDGERKPPEEALPILQRVQQAFESLVDRVGPATVTIEVRPGPGEAANGEDPPSEASVDTGSGVIIGADGTILTSEHVVQGTGTVHVTLHDGRRCRARRVATDSRSDLAVIRIQAEGLIVAALGDAENLRRGRLVLALGNPLGLSLDGQIAVSEGVVAAIGRPLPDALGREQDRYYGDMIQTSIRVGPGSSGGPLIDIDGRVVGIITAMGGRSGSAGFGFAVPINAHTKAIITRLIQGRPIEYGYLGLEVRSLHPSEVQAAGTEKGQGVFVDFVLEDGPAMQAGLRRGDIIMTVDAAPVNSPDRFVQLVGAAGPDRRVQIGFLRDSKLETTGVMLTRRTPTSQEERSSRTVSFRGAVLEEVGPAMRATVNLPKNAMLVTMVADGSPAARAGLTPGDVVVRINGDAPQPDAGAQFANLQGDVLLGLANGGSVLLKSR